LCFSLHSSYPVSISASPLNCDERLCVGLLILDTQCLMRCLTCEHRWNLLAEMMGGGEEVVLLFPFCVCTECHLLTWSCPKWMFAAWIASWVQIIAVLLEGFVLLSKLVEQCLGSSLLAWFKVILML
jgi:hypothetical protein